jgi:23S rRNA pseudouridine1911/1915/1917 synthase
MSASAAAPAGAKSELKILFEDNHCVAVAKPHGLLTQSDATGDDSLLEQVRSLIKVRDSKPGNVFLGLVHRLDRPVGGVVVFGKTSKGASRLSEQFREHSVTKTYWAAVEGAPKNARGTVRQWIAKDERSNVATAYDHEVPGSKEAELSYRILAEEDGRTLVEVTPKTGRSHQIRLAMKSLGTPIVGDLKYGAKQPFLDGRAIALFAVSLEFASPVGADPVLAATAPEWPFFKNMKVDSEPPTE